MVDQFHSGGHFPELGRETVRGHGIGQDEDVIALRQEVQADGFSFPLAHAGIATAGTDEDTGAFLVLAAHFCHVVGQE